MIGQRIDGSFLGRSVRDASRIKDVKSKAITLIGLVPIHDGSIKVIIDYFFLVYLAFNWHSVVATSMEQRHLAQFCGAMVVLAGFPDTRNPKTREELGTVWGVWFPVVVAVHLGRLELKLF